MDGPINERRAARVICVDPGGRVLLLRWRDPADGRVLWEPPGGGIDPGETPLMTARRELREETGLPGEAVLDRWIPVRRDLMWNGQRYVRTEPFYVAMFGDAPPVAPSAFTEEETSTYLGAAWLSPAEIATLDEDVEPPNLLEIVNTLLRAPST